MRSPLVGLPLLAILLCACSAPQTVAPAPKPAVAAPPPAFAWETADALTMGLDTDALQQHEAICKDSGADACLVVYKGKIVQEYRSPTYQEPIDVKSSTKSVTALIVGLLKDEGKIKTLDEPVCTYLQDWCEGDKGKATLRHLLTMTAGLANIATDRDLHQAPDSIEYARKLPVVRAPGAAWDYSNEGAQLLSSIIDKAAGEPAYQYAARRLFRPLGMANTFMGTDPSGHTRTYTELWTTPRDFARIGLMMLNKGMWNGQRVLSSQWVDEATSPLVTAGQRKYGYLWWVAPDRSFYMADGSLRNYLFVFPKLDLIVVRMQSREGPGGEIYDQKALPLLPKLVRAS